MSINSASINSNIPLSDLGQEMIKQTKKSLIGRHVAWIKEPRSGAAKVGVGVLVAMEHLVLSLSLIGLIPLYKGWDTSSKLSNYETLANSSKSAEPPPFDIVEKKTARATFNHVDYFAIYDGQLWYKPIKNAKNVPWKLFFFDGFPKGKVPQEIMADGANLVVLDEKRKVHYKKVLSEGWTKGKYVFKDITAKDNWYDRWYSLPIVRRIYHIFVSFKLKIPKDCKGWAISHRGEYNKFFTDLNGNKHPEFPMVTTLYILPAKGNYIEYADPFVSFGFKHRVPGPNNPDFTPEAISVSGSMILLFGYEVKKGIKTPKLYTRLADFDTLRKNPFLPGFWNKNWAPSQEWEELPIKLKDKATITKGITISQTGTGNDARKIQVDGTNKHGFPGQWVKQDMKADWVFHAD